MQPGATSRNPPTNGYRSDDHRLPPLPRNLGCPRLVPDHGDRLHRLGRRRRGTHGRQPDLGGEGGRPDHRRRAFPGGIPAGVDPGVRQAAARAGRASQPAQQYRRRNAAAADPASCAATGSAAPARGGAGLGDPADDPGHACIPRQAGEVQQPALPGRAAEQRPERAKLRSDDARRPGAASGAGGGRHRRRRPAGGSSSPVPGAIRKAFGRHGGISVRCGNRPGAHPGGPAALVRKPSVRLQLSRNAPRQGDHPVTADFGEGDSDHRQGAARRLCAAYAGIRQRRRSARRR